MQQEACRAIGPVLPFRVGPGLLVGLLFVLSLGRAAAAHENTWTLAAIERGESLRGVGHASTPAPQSPAPGQAALRVRLVDAVSGRTLPGLLRVRPEDGGPALAIAGPIPRELGWVAIAGAVDLLLPAGERLRFEALHGLASRAVAHTLDPAELDGRELRLEVSSFFDPRAEGWLGANTHLHLKGITRPQAERYLSVVGPADGLDWIWVSYLERAGSNAFYVSNELRPPDLERLSSEQTRFGWGEELRHNFGEYDEGYGHALLLDIPELIQPVSIGPSIAKEGTDGQPLQEGIDEARRVGGKVLWCHNGFGIEDAPNWVTGRVDAQNIYDGSWSQGYEETFYRYLGLGLTVPFSTGTDWFVTDFNRVYVQVEDRTSSQAYLDALAEGRSFITNGPFLDLRVDGASPGGTVSLDGPASAAVVARGIGRRNFGGLEVVQNGRVVARAKSVAAEGFFEARLEATIEVGEPGWVALRIASTTEKSELGGPLFGHTSAVFLEMNGRRAFDAMDARALALEIDWHGRDIPRRGVFASEAEVERVVSVYRAATRELAARLPWHQRIYVSLRTAARGLRDWIRSWLAGWAAT